MQHWDRHLPEPIRLSDGRGLATVRDLDAYLYQSPITLFDVRHCVSRAAATGRAADRGVALDAARRLLRACRLM